MCANNEKLELGNGCLSILTFLSGRKEIKRCFGVAEAVSCAYINGTLELCQSKLTSCQLVLARQCLRKLSHYNKQGPTKLTIKVGRNRISGKRSATAKYRACIHLLQSQRESGTKYRILSRRNRPAVGRAEAGHPIRSTLSL
jgi:hypothetical protein